VGKILWELVMALGGIMGCERILHRNVENVSRHEFFVSENAADSARSTTKA
jgi:hypothetical protein